MKTKLFIIGLLAFAITLGVACKKEEIVKEPVKTEIQKPSIKANAPVDGGGIGGYPGGANVFPHNTGICYCGVYSTCHPEAWWLHTSGNHNSGCTYGCGLTHPPY